MFIPIIVIGWMFVALMAAVAEASAPNGTVLGAIFTFLGWGVIPLSVLVYILATPMRRAKRQAEQHAAEQVAEQVAEAAAANTKHQEPDHA
jgi:mannose/fructose/N-acetylgalactosamine-specific phosphotransferase system component IID